MVRQRVEFGASGGCPNGANVACWRDRYLDWFINELPKTFHPKRWDPDEIAALAKVCGMRYVVLTAEHHSGFCLWDTKTTDFNITNTPYGEDMLPQTMAALRRHGLKVGLYYSPEDFAWLYRHRFPVRRRGDDLLDPDVHPQYKEFVRQQVTELFSKYGPILTPLNNRSRLPCRYEHP